MATDTNLQGLACDHASCEVSVDGFPLPNAFSSIDPSWELVSEKIWVNGTARPIDRTEGKFDASCDAEMPWKHWCQMKQALGGGGETGTDYMLVEFSVTITFRPKADDSTYTVILSKCRVEKVGMSSKHGEHAMAKLTLSVMDIDDQPPA